MIIQAKNKLKELSPLVHIIAGSISVNDCANFALSTGAKPITCIYDKETEEITKNAKALFVSLAQFDQERINVATKAVETAIGEGIPVCLDAVGINISKERFDFFKKITDKFKISVIKGNTAEIKALLNIKAKSTGIDVLPEDFKEEENIEICKKAAKEYGTVIFATAKTDIITDGTTVHTVVGGNEAMQLITGTGCILGSVCACYLTVEEPLNACVCASTLLKKSGELSCEQGCLKKGIASYKTGLWDNFYNLAYTDSLDRLHL